MKRIVHILVILTILVVFSSGYSTERAGFDFLRHEMAARPAALGGAFISIPGDLTGIYYNPASLASINGPHIQGTFTDQIFDLKSGSFLYAQPHKEIGVFTIGVHYLNYGEFKEIDLIGNEVGTFGASDLLFSLAYANHLMEHLTGGVSLNWIQSNIESYSASAIGLNAGLLYEIPSQMMHVGLSVRNFGTSVKSFIDTKEKLPTSYQLGLSKRLEHLPLLMNVSVLRYQYEESSSMGGFYLSAGGEFQLSPVVGLRFGYNSRAQEEKVEVEQDRLAGVSLGIGIHLKKYNIDITRSSYGILGAMTHFTLSYQL